MPYYFTIELPSSEGAPSEWVRLIDSHAALRHPTPKDGINPFTRQPIQIKPHPSTAEIVKDGVRVGGIGQAPDEPDILVGWAEDEPYGVGIAEEIAKALGGRFVHGGSQE